MVMETGPMAVKVHGLMAFTAPLFQRGVRRPEGKTLVCSEAPALHLPHCPRDQDPSLPQGGEAQSPSRNSSSQSHRDGGTCLSWQAKKVCESGWVCMLHAKVRFS